MWLCLPFSLQRWQMWLCPLPWGSPPAGVAAASATVPSPGMHVRVHAYRAQVLQGEAWAGVCFTKSKSQHLFLVWRG